jgi:hypothetical protein
LNGLSIVEYSTHYNDFPNLLAAVPYANTPAERMLLVTRWFMSTLYGSYHERCEKGTEKKPYNPILGEQLLCEWSQEDKVEVKDAQLTGFEQWQKSRIVVEQGKIHLAYHCS